MPKVRVPRKNVTPGEIVTVLSRRLGAGYQVESDGGRRVTVRKSALRYANISISDQPGASVFGVHGGGFIVLRLPRGRRPAPLPRVPQPLNLPSAVSAARPPAL